MADVLVVQVEISQLLRGGVGMMGRVFKALHTGAGPGGRVHRDTAPTIWCI